VCESVSSVSVCPALILNASDPSTPSPFSAYAGTYVQTAMAQNQAIKELDGFRSDWTSVAVSKAETLPHDVYEWFSDLFKQDEAEVKVEKKIKFKRNKNAELASIAGRNAREAAVRAREEMDKARTSMEQAKQAAHEARNIPELYRKKHVEMAGTQVEQKPLSNLHVKFSQGKNFPLIGDGYLRQEANVYAKVSLHDPKAKEIEPQSFSTATQYQETHPQFLNEFDFQVASDWHDEDRHEYLKIVFYHEAKSLVGFKKQDPEHDHEYGRYQIGLREFVKLTPERRFPDGSKEPAMFHGSILKWFKLHDEDNSPSPGLDPTEGPPAFQVQLVYTDSLQAKKFGHAGVKPVQFPDRPAFRPPPPKVSLLPV